MAKERSDSERRIILANPDEPRAGDHGFSFYEKTRPMIGDENMINSIRRQLRGMSGKDVIVTINGARLFDDDSKNRRFKLRRRVHLNTYRDIFGSQGVYLDALHSAVEVDSEAMIVTFSIEISSEE